MVYLPFGETLVEEHQNSPNTPYKFTGQHHDSETGNYYVSARYYNPKWSTWLSVDPLAETTMQPYSAFNNNPIYFNDPTGMIAQGPDTWIVNGDTGDSTYIDDGSDDIVVVSGDNYSTTVAAGELSVSSNSNYKYATALYNSKLSEGDRYSANEYGVYRFPESGKGFERYSTNANNENYTVDGQKHNGDNYVSSSGFLALYKTFVEFYNETGITSRYGDTSAFDPRVQLGHSTHFRGSAVDIHYFGKDGVELSGASAYRSADVSLVNSFFSIAESNGFTSNYSYGGRFSHTGNNNQSLHKDHFHIGLPDSGKYFQKGVGYGKRANVPLP